MRKLKLNLDALDVESYETGYVVGVGTVAAYSAWDASGCGPCDTDACPAPKPTGNEATCCYTGCRNITDASWCPPG